MRTLVRARRVAALVAALALAVLLPLVVTAHPLGNFTINHYAGIRVAPDRILLDIVIDQAEIPTFQERTRMDADGDGTLSPAEIETERLAACPRLGADLSLAVGAARPELVPTAAGLSFPLGASGVETTRLVCEFSAMLAAPVAAATKIRFEDRSNVDRIGWREIAVQGDGTTIDSTLPVTSVSHRLTVYPQDLLAQPLDIRVASLTAASGGPALPAWSAPDATPLAPAAATGGATVGGLATSAAPVPGASTPAAPPVVASATPSTAAVPGGVAGEISGLLGASELTPLVLILSFLTAVLLGAGHALTPGHGKTIMAAYLVGTRGTARHALGLGLATAVSHTIGVLLLALLIVFAGSALPADRVYPILTGASGIIVVVIGASLLAAQITKWLRTNRQSRLVPATAGGSVDAHGHSHTGGADNEHAHTHAQGSRAMLAAATATVADAGRYGAARTFPIGGAAGAVGAQATSSVAAGTHRHGWRVHSHVPATAAEPLSWRSLVALGLSGGLVPSTNALLILVATVAAGRAGYGVVLVIAFGIGMAAVLVGVGLALVYASGLMARAPRTPAIGHLLALAPTIAAAAVLALGLFLTAQALSGSTVF